MIVFKKITCGIFLNTSIKYCLLSGSNQDLSLSRLYPLHQTILSLSRLYPLHQTILPIWFEWWILFFDNKDKFVGSFTTVHANLMEQKTSSIELVVLKCRIIVVIRKRFQMFITQATPIGATSTNFVVKRDLQKFCSTCGSLRKSFWRHDMKNSQPHLNDCFYYLEQ